MREPFVDHRSTPRSRRSAREHDRAERIAPVELAAWLREHDDRLGRQWLNAVLHRHGDRDAGAGGLLEEFVGVLVPILPAFLGPYREQVEPLWKQASELYGSVAAMRGLAAGEVIEEFQLLREELLRLFYDEPPVRDLDHLTLRDVLRLNRIVDMGVTHASVGHTDALFFALFQGSGVPRSLTEEQVAEVRSQLESIDAEFRGVMELLEG